MAVYFLLGPCFLYVQSSRWGKESWLFDFLSSSWCYVAVICLFLTVPWIGLQLDFGHNSFYLIVAAVNFKEVPL